jgi:alpha-L-arabinofuranosidase
VRFPGGCMSLWPGARQHSTAGTETVGPWQRPQAGPQHLELSPDPRTGFYEYFQSAKDIGAEPLPVLAAACPARTRARQHRHGRTAVWHSHGRHAAYCQEGSSTMIEWANATPPPRSGPRCAPTPVTPRPSNLK